MVSESLDYESIGSLVQTKSYLIFVSFVSSVCAPEVFNVVHKFDDSNWLTCSYLIYNPHRRREAWRFLTYIFLHGGIEHITFNLIIQVLVGKLIMPLICNQF